MLKSFIYLPLSSNTQVLNYVVKSVPIFLLAHGTHKAQ